MPSASTSIDTETAYRLHRKALAENRTVSDLIRKAILNDLEKSPAPFIESDAVIERHDNGSKRVVGAYLSRSLASAIQRIALEQDRSQSYVLRGLIREALKMRGALPPVGNERDRLQEKNSVLESKRND
jgi:hypothetical protein